MSHLQPSEPAQPRARYSTRWPAAGALPPSRSGLSSRVSELSVNQWVALICLGVVLFMGLTLAAGLLVGSTLRGRLTARASTLLPVSRAETPSSSTPSDTQVSPRPPSDVFAAGVSLRIDRALQPGDNAPDFQLEVLDGGVLSLGDLKGHTVLVNFWATWCIWCRYELPALQVVSDKYKSKGLVVLGVNVEEPRPLVESYVQRYGVSFPVVLDVDGTTAEAYRVRGLPMTYFVNRNGIIVRVQRGAMREDELELYVRNALVDK